MHLINVKTRRLESFEASPPAYAILSHTWGLNEITFQDFQSSATEPLKSVKINGCCAQAFKDGFGYVWIDTCCIDKSSSAELSEAINSMYSWYQKSAICYVFLSDVPECQDPSLANSKFRHSRWFTRGWTLQELLAPPRLTFYDQDWGIVGQELKHPESEAGSRWKRLASVVASITGIPFPYIDHSKPISQASVAERMSWAAARTTTRVEDMAYCLLGLFDVNMPLLYGEGQKAFVRLQEEIAKEYDDHSLFFWHDQSSTATGGSCFARRPADFYGSGDTRIIKPDSIYYVKSGHYLTTNKGLLIQLSVIQLESRDYVARLSCSTSTLDVGGDGKMCVAIPLVRIWGEKNSFYRPSTVRPQLVRSSSFRNIAPTSMYIAKASPVYETWASGFTIQPSFIELLSINTFHPPNWANGEVMATEQDVKSGHQVIFLDCTDRDRRNIAIRIEYSYKVADSNRRELRPRNLRCFLALIPKPKSLMELLVMEAAETRQDDLDWASTLCTETYQAAFDLTTRVSLTESQTDGTRASSAWKIGLKWHLS